MAAVGESAIAGEAGPTPTRRRPPSGAATGPFVPLDVRAVPISHLVARVPSPGFVAAAGSVLAIVLTLFSAFESVTPHPQDSLLHHFAIRLLVDSSSLLAVVLVVALARWLVPHQLFLSPPASRALMLSFGAYTLAGIVGGVARYHLRVWLGLSWEVAFPWEFLTNVGAGILSFTMVGVLASQFYPFMERLDRLRALSAMADQAAEIAAQGAFGHRLSLADRRDEVGHLARTINHLLETVESTLRSHRDFLADTSHELRNPLQAIRTNLELMGRTKDPQALAECLRESMQQVERMSRLVSDLLTLARLESAQIVERRPVALRPLVEGAIRGAQRLARGQQVQLEHADEVEALGDEVRLRQVLDNLLANALQHTPEGGRITLRLQRQEDWAIVEVADTGRGIPPEHLPHVFDRFYRVGKARTDGAGLGLAIVKHLCEAQGGSVAVESEPGRGSRFTVWIPVA